MICQNVLLQGLWIMSKGSNRRPEDASKIANNWDAIFKNKPSGLVEDKSNFDKQDSYGELVAKWNAWPFPTSYRASEFFKSK